MAQFNNLIQVITHFADEVVATEHLIQMRWNGNITCVHCNHDKIYTLKGATKRFKCAGCRKQFSATKGTIFENSAIPLQKWFAAVYILTSHKKGISSHQLAKDISITQKSAWFVLQRVRFALKSGSFNYTSTDTIQCDETYVGGKEKNRHQGKTDKVERMLSRRAQGLPMKAKAGAAEKTAVFGMIVTGGMVKAEVVQNTTTETLTGIIEKNIQPGITIVTDDYKSYRKLQQNYTHKSVNHSKGQYCKNGFHTNGIENFWSIFKRGIIGIYHQVSDKHLDKYIDEFEFRFNNRNCTEANRFDKMLSLCNTRLTYAQLIAE